MEFFPCALACPYGRTIMRNMRSIEAVAFFKFECRNCYCCSHNLKIRKIKLYKRIIESINILSISEIFARNVKISVVLIFVEVHRIAIFEAFASHRNGTTQQALCIVFAIFFIPTFNFFESFEIHGQEVVRAKIIKGRILIH